MQKITATSAQAQSANLLADHIEQLKALFPELITEGAAGVSVNVDVLKALIGDQTVGDADEKYGLNWHGKRRARQLALTPSTGTLRPRPDESMDWDSTQNLMIEGDNLEVLKLLQKSYAGQVKLIYIDPPYNTGKDFVYPDNFQDNIKNYLELTGQVEGGAKISSNTDTSGRFHTDWLNMMYPRLKLARNLLRKDGVLMMSIDDKELHHLRLLANEVFGEENFVASVSVVSNMKGRNDKKHIAACHEYIVIYAAPGFVSNGLPLTEEQKAAFKHSDAAGQPYALRDLRKRGGPDRREDRPKMFFPIFWNETTDRCTLKRMSDADTEILPLRGDGAEGCWRWGMEKVKKHLDWLKAKRSERSGRLDVAHRLYLDPGISLDLESVDEEDEDDEGAIERTSKPKSIWLGGEFSSDSGKRALKELLPGAAFDFPKSVELLRTCALLSTSKDDIVLDFFAGSATSGQAVMTQNALDGQQRRYILVQLPEPLDPNNKEQKAAADYCDQLGKPRTIAELTKERLRRAAIKIRATEADKTRATAQLTLEEDQKQPAAPLDLGFRVFKLDHSNIRAWNPNRDDLAQAVLDHEDHLVAGRTETDILYELLLKRGLDLCVAINKRVIGGKDVYAIDGGVLLACLAENISPSDVEALAQGLVAWHQELKHTGASTCVFRDSAFEDDVTKTNLAAILAQHGMANVRSL